MTSGSSRPSTTLIPVWTQIAFAGVAWTGCSLVSPLGRARALAIPYRNRAEALHRQHVVPGHGPGHLRRVAGVLAQPALGRGDRRGAAHLVDLHCRQIDLA